jgi:hypothetical protein
MAGLTWSTTKTRALASEIRFHFKLSTDGKEEEGAVGYPQLATLIAPTFVMLAILVVPAAVYVRLLQRAKEREIERLAREIAESRTTVKAAATNEEKENARKLEAQKETVEEQRP